MKHRVFTAALLGAAAWFGLGAGDASAFGGGMFKKKSCAAPCDTAPHYGHHAAGYAGSGCGSPCGMAGPVAPAAPAVTWVDQEVTVKEAKWTTVPTKVTVMKPVEVSKEVVYKVSSWATVKKEVTVNECVPVQQPYEYWVNNVVTTQEERVVTNYTQSWDKVLVPVTTWQCVPRQVTEMKTVTHKVPSCDPCGPKWHCVTECVPVCKTVVDRVPVTTTVEKMVCKSTPVTSKVMVPVTKCVPTKATGTRTVNTWVPVKKTVDVQECVWTDKKETVKVWECKAVEETVNVQKCEWVDVKKTVKVAQYAPAMPTTTAVGTSMGCGGCGDMHHAPAYYADHGKKAGFSLCGKMKGFGKSSCGGCH